MWTRRRPTSYLGHRTSAADSVSLASSGAGIHREDISHRWSAWSRCRWRTHGSLVKEREDNEKNMNAFPFIAGSPESGRHPRSYVRHLCVCVCVGITWFTLVAAPVVAFEVKCFITLERSGVCSLKYRRQRQSVVCLFTSLQMR